MYGEKEPLGRIVKISAQRKSNGAIGGGRKGTSGKKGTIYQVHEDGARKELASISESTFKSLSRALRKTGLIPQHVTLNSHGETSF